MNYWLHRISYHAEVARPLLVRNYLSIGFSDFSDKEFIDKVHKGGDKEWEYLENEFQEGWNCRPRTRYNLWRFIAGMRKGDWVIVPDWKTFSIFEVLEDNALPVSEIDIDGLKDWSGNIITISEKGHLCRNSDNEEKSIDIGPVRRVHLLHKGIPRYDFSDSALTARLKTQMTNADITDLKANIDEAVDAYLSNRPLNIHSQILDKLRDHMLDIIKTKLTPEKFEKLVEFYFKRIDASNTSIPPKNERDKTGDADVIAEFDNIKTIIYTQVKFHKNGATNEEAVEQIKDYKSQKETMDDSFFRIGWVITTASSFTEDAINNAKAEKIQLIDGPQFVTMLLNAGIENLDDAI